MITGRQLTRARNTASDFLTATITIRRVDPDEVTYTDGHLTAGSSATIWQGPASISNVTGRDTTAVTGGETVQTESWLIRAPLDAQAVEPGDELTVDDPGDFPIPHRHLWIRSVQGRQVGVLARLEATATRPGSVDGR